MTVSYFEWLQNQVNEQWDYDTTTEKMPARLHAATGTVINRWQTIVIGEESTNNPLPDFRSVALVIAIKRVAQATLMRGIWPLADKMRLVLTTKVHILI